MKKKWKSITALALSAALMLGSFSTDLSNGLSFELFGKVYAAEEADENGFVIEDGVLKKYIGTAEDVVIPEGVTSIKSQVFFDCSTLKSITIPKSVTSIGDEAFYGNSLERIVVEDGNPNYDSRENCNAIIESKKNRLVAGCGNTIIPESVTSIGNEAFICCGNLTDISIPESVTSIGISAFCGCSSLTGISIPESVTNIGVGAFSSCEALKEISLPTGLTSIEKSLFSRCSSLENVSLPENVKYIGQTAFSNCDSLESINIPDGVTSIGQEAFIFCSNLTDISIPKSVTRIKSDAFRETKWLENQRKINPLVIVNDILIDGQTCSGNVTIPEGVTSIGSFAFSHYCDSLESISIPESVTNIGEYAFDDCKALKEIVLPAGVTHIERGLFSDCSSLETVSLPDGILNIGSYAFSNCSSLTGINLPESVTSIGSDAFRNCINLASINIPESVRSIDSYVFSGCNKLQSIHVSENNNCFSEYDGCLYTKDKKELLICPEGKEEANIAGGVTSIGSLAFSGCSGLTNISLPESVMSIGSFAFSRCERLENITIPKSLVNIEARAFSGTQWLKKQQGENPLVIVNGILVDGTACSGNVVIPEGVTSVGEWAFYNCSSLTSIHIPEGVTSIGNSAFYNCSSLVSVSMPKGVTDIGNSAFSGCSSLESISIPKELTDIGGSVFSDTKWLANKRKENPIVVLNGVLIDGRACHGEITIPVGVTDIASFAFYGCEDLTGVRLPDGIRKIESDAFEYCFDLQHINIPDSVTDIGSYAFFNCLALEDVAVPKSVTKIGTFAFSLTKWMENKEEENPFVIVNGFLIGAETNERVVRIPDGVNKICSSTFYYRSENLERIVIPDSVAEIESNSISDKLVIYGKEGSCAETYAKEKGMLFMPLTDKGYEVTLEKGKTSLSASKMEELLTENEIQKVAIETAEGLVYTFELGSMKLAERKEFYDFGAEISQDYTSLSSSSFTEDEFAFRIDYNYEGELPGIAKISIPVDNKWIGKRLYYYEIDENGEYQYISRTAVAKDGTYTVKQDHCSSYVATTKAPEKLGDCDGEEGITAKDALAILKYDVGIPQENFDVRFADCDGEDGITSMDALAILKFDVGILDELY